MMVYVKNNNNGYTKMYLRTYTYMQVCIYTSFTFQTCVFRCFQEVDTSMYLWTQKYTYGHKTSKYMQTKMYKYINKQIHK